MINNADESSKNTTEREFNLTRLEERGELSPGDYIYLDSRAVPTYVQLLKDGKDVMDTDLKAKILPLTEKRYRVEWERDKKAYYLSNLTDILFDASSDRKHSTSGPDHWMLADGRNISKLATNKL